MKQVSLSVLLVAILAGCSQLAQEQAGSQARFVEAAKLERGEVAVRGEVITSVPLRHLSAQQAEDGLRAKLPKGVHVARVGSSNGLLLQGPSHGVVTAIHTLRSLDVE